MATVSRGEITITNVNDGKPSYTHPAWSWSADGTDRFTTVYPGENLLLNTSDFTSVKNWGANDITTISVEDGCLSVYKSTASKYRGVAQTIPVPEGAHGKRFRLSTTAKGASDNTALGNGVIIHYLNGSGIASQQSVYGAPNLTTEFQHLKYTYATVPEDTSVTKIRVIFMYDDKGTVCHVLHKNFKLAFEDSASIYTPAPSDDYANAYPTYAGTYTDYEPTGSEDPSKYTWQRILGQGGGDGKDGESAPLISLSGATQVITVSKTGVITPSSSFTVVGTPVNTTITGWLYSVDGGAFVTTLPTGVTRSTNTVTINPATSTFKTLSIRAADAKVMDIFTIARIIEAKDGAQGAPGTNGTNGSNGAAGKDAYTVILSNEAYTFPGSTTGALAGSTTTTISVYKGITKVNPTSITVGTKPTGMTSTVSGLASAIVTFTVTTAMVTKGGTVPIDIVVDGITFTKLFSYAISLQGVKGTDGGIGPQGPPGVNGKEVFSGYLSNDSIVVPANNAGTVTDFSKANGKFTTFLGQVQLTSGVVYSLVSNSGLTSTINSSTGAYSVTAISGDTGTATYKAVYNGITIQKILIVTKSKQGPNGATGPAGAPTGIIAQTTAPASPYVGMLWKNTTSGNGATYRWTGSAWEAYVFTAVNISAENLSAIVSRIGEIYNDYSRTYNDGTSAVGTLAIKDAEINNSGVIKNSSGTTIQTYESIVSHQLISMARYSGAGSVGDQNKLVASLGITFNSIVLNDRENGFSGQITAEQLTNVPWKTLPLAAGFAETEGATPQYRKIQNIDGSFSVQLRGRCGPTTGAFGAGTGTRIGTLPVGTRPTRLAMFPVAFSGGFVGRLQVELNGDLMVQVNQAGRTVTMIDGIVLPLG